MENNDVEIGYIAHELTHLCRKGTFVTTFNL